MMNKLFFFFIILILHVFLFLQPRSSLCFTACFLSLSILDKPLLQLIPCSCGKDSQLNGKRAGVLDCNTACKTRILPVHPMSASENRLCILFFESSSHHYTRCFISNITDHWSAVKTLILRIAGLKCNKTSPWPYYMVPGKMDLFPLWYWDQWKCALKGFYWMWGRYCMYETSLGLYWWKMVVYHWADDWRSSERHSLAAENDWHSRSRKVCLNTAHWRGKSLYTVMWLTMSRLSPALLNSLYVTVL